MAIFDVKSEEKLAYIFLIIISIVIGIVAVLLPLSADGEVDPKMFVAMLICFAISAYFIIQYIIYEKENKKRKPFSFDLKKELDAADSSENTEEKKKFVS